MASQNESLPDMDDIPVQAATGPTEQELLDAVLQNTGFLEGSLPDEEIPEVDPSESDYEEEDPEESDEVVNEEDEEEVEDTDEVEEEDEDASEEDATQDDSVFTPDDLDLDAKLRVKIDGEEVEVSFSDLIKGYSTEQSLSTKGRELGEARKQLEAEKAEQLSEIGKLGQASSAILMSQENTLAKEYHNIEAQIKKARADGDTFELAELKDKREEVQQRYWQARQQREGLVETLEKQQREVFEKQWKEQLDNFYEKIEEYVPGFNEEVASELREFAISEGLPEDLLNGITDPAVVKFVNDYRMLKQGVSKGEAKRKAAPTKKVPVKKAKSPTKKKEDKAKIVKARAFREDASQEDQMDFLRQIASRSLGN